jgi:hypothetical protein
MNRDTFSLIVLLFVNLHGIKSPAQAGLGHFLLSPPGGMSKGGAKSKCAALFFAAACKHSAQLEIMNWVHQFDFAEYAGGFL